jgi:DNA topoisomerase VI subunit B
MIKDTDSVIAEFQKVVNMTAKELKSWLETEESQAVGQKKEKESIGHQSGQKIVTILQKKRKSIYGRRYFSHEESH